jgi:ATP-binding cassette subfamily B protein
MQFVGVLMMTLLGAAAELVGIGAVVPFLQLVAAPETLTDWGIVQPALALTGGRDVSDLIVPAAALLVAAAIVSALMRIALIWVTLNYVYSLTNDIANIVFDRIIHQPYGLYVRRNSSEALSGIDKVGLIGSYLLNPLLQAISSAIIAIAIIGFLFAIDPVTAGIAGGTMIAFYAVVGAFARPMMLKAGMSLAAAATQRVKLVQESLGGIRDIILDRLYAQFGKQFAEVQNEVRRLDTMNAFTSTAPRFLIEGAGIVLIALLAVYYSGQPGGVVAAVPVLGALALGSQRLLPLLQSLNVAWVQYFAMIGRVGDVLQLIEAPILPEAPRLRPDQIKPMRRSIELRGLSFDYGPDITALSNVDLIIPKGRRVGFVGRTGSGKSTLLDIIMGLLEPTKGDVLIDGVPLGPSTMNNWQAQIAHVPQSIFLTDDSIAANIAFGSSADSFDMDRVRDAARRADIAEFIDTLPQGYLTAAGERGLRLSGGQRQRVGIARALYKRATVLVLDEATSALDDETETAVMDGIERLDRDLTILLIAHRLSTVRACDMVVRLDAGRITEVGSYEDVVEPAR